MSANLTSRLAVKAVLAREQAEGDGARVRRSIGTPSLRNFTPFLMLDHFVIDQPEAGFPSHFHRGMSTLTYMVEGSSLHEDFKGHKGELKAGDVQFMIAGKGILHSEMPQYKQGGPVPSGLQLWIDLPQQHKMTEPTYQELKANEIPDARPSDGVHIKVICGEAEDATKGTVSSPVKPLGGCWFLDVNLKAGSSVFQRLPKGWNSFLYTYKGKIAVGPVDKAVDAHHTVVLTNDDDQEGVELRAVDGDARVMLVSGEPLDQPIVQYGPVVMCSAQEVRQAFMDYSLAKNGFEGAHDWKASIDTQG